MDFCRLLLILLRCLVRRLTLLFSLFLQKTAALLLAIPTCALRMPGAALSRGARLTAGAVGSVGGAAGEALDVPGLLVGLASGLVIEGLLSRPLGPLPYLAKVVVRHYVGVSVKHVVAAAAGQELLEQVNVYAGVILVFVAVFFLWSRLRRAEEVCYQLDQRQNHS